MRYQVNGARSFGCTFEQQFVDLREALIKVYELGTLGFSNLEVINLETNVNVLNSHDFLQNSYQEWN